MSAAAPLPPPAHRPPGASAPAPSAQRGPSRPPPGSSNSTTRRDRQGNNGAPGYGTSPGGGSIGGGSIGGGGSSGGERVFVHISDLQVEALSGLNNSTHSITQLFMCAEQSLKDAKFNIDFRRPDRAFVEYLRAYEIAVELIPHKRDYIHFAHDQHGQQKLQVLQRRIAGLADQYAEIKQIIINNNSRSGVYPRSQQQPRAANGTALPSAGAHKTKPSISPKPENLHARPISLNEDATSYTAGTLTDRFAKLRSSGIGNSGSRASMSSFQTTLMPTAGDYRGNTETVGSTILKPQGPRKMPLDTELAAAMPKAPSPTYSPARNMQTTGDMTLPRHSVRSLASSRKSSVLPNSTTYPTTASPDDGEPSPGVYEDENLPHPSLRHKSVHVPEETRITAEKLYDYLERFNIMVIDCRSRIDFDQGHIYSRNVICIEPVGLRQGLSAEQLAEQLVISPEEEQEVFHNRDQYDLVVYYDTDTKSDNYLSTPVNEAETRLKYLHEALYEFNQEKQLQRSPIILIGGIDAWIDLMGHQALVTTSTQARVKSGRPIQRRIPNRSGQIKLPKHRLRDYNPLDAEEEQRWRDRAQSESMPEALALSGQEVNGDEINDFDELQRFPNIEEFNARFPDAGAATPRSYPTILAPATIPGSNVPKYPSNPVHAVYPRAPPPPPARPAPAAPRMSYTGVSDRAVSQSTPISRNSSQLLPYVPPRFLAQNLRLPRTGIQNFGNTCYMNATLQALSATTPLTLLVLDDQYKKLVQKDNWKGSRGLLPEIYANTIRSLWQGGVDYIKPTTLLNFCGRLNSTFKDPNQQQDAQEFFSFIVDCLHEDFNAVWSKTPLRVLTEQEEAKRERMPALVVARTEWGRYIHREKSFLTSLFYGQHSSRLRCTKCNCTSTTYEAWALLQVEIPDSPEAKLQDCLRAHFKDELLDAENQWSCPTCKVPRRATKKLTMTRAPPFLVVALKRFKQNARGEQRKLHTSVRFPLTGLNMEEFVLPQPSTQEAQQIAQGYGHDLLKVEDSLGPPYIYDAYAVVRHLGDTTRSGHYTSAVRDKARGCWRYFNDTRYQDFQPETMSPGQALDNDQAYFIFYQRRSVNEHSAK